MTVDVVVNPRDADAPYFEGLRACFPGAWDQTAYRWYLKRPFDGLAPDLIAALVGSEIAAGVGVNYRRLRLVGRDDVLVGVLTAAWTLPQHRGRWYFSRLVARAKAVAQSRGAKALLGFVTLDNASAANLKHAKAVAIPSFYLLAPSTKSLVAQRLPEPVLIDEPTFPEIDSASVAFRYSSKTWHEQFVERPNPTHTFLVDSRSAIVETVSGTDRLLWISGPPADAGRVVAAMLARAHALNRDFFHFTLSEQAAREAASLGVGVRAGAVMVLDLDVDHASSTGEHWTAASWAIQAGDRL